MYTMRLSDMTPENNVIKLLEEVGFKRLSDNEDGPGYLLRWGLSGGKREIVVFLKKGYLNINLTPSYIILDVHRSDTVYYYKERPRRTWYYVKQVKYKKEAGMEEFRNFLLLSVCRDSFLDSDEEAYQIRKDEGFYVNKEWNDWYL